MSYVPQIRPSPLRSYPTEISWCSTDRLLNLNYLGLRQLASRLHIYKPISTFAPQTTQSHNYFFYY